MVAVIGSTGAYLRNAPGGEIIKSYMNGTIVEILPETEMVSGMVWVRIKGPDGTQGWVLQSLLTTPIPTP
jgi:SH3-like domain-containing protein